jgi:hypothetical protein
MNTYGRGNPEVERVIAEMNALNAALSACSPALAREAQGMVRAVEGAWPEPLTVADFTVRAAMARITGGSPPTGDPERTVMPPWPMRAFELVALAWLAWSRGDMDLATHHIERWVAEAAMPENLSNSEGAIQGFAIALWANAIEALIEGRAEDSRRFYERVYQVGSSFGTESHPTVLWTMAASFFTPEG